jgi:hypothetical protein
MTPTEREYAARQREFINEMLGFVRLYADIAQGFAFAGDDGGLAYAIEKVGLYVRETIKAKTELIEFRRKATA